MVDEVARLCAADLVEMLRDGGISNFDFEESWPLYDRRDKAVIAVETMLWRYYDDGFEHKLTDEGHLLDSEGHKTFSRCAAFLRSNLEYEWPDDNFASVGGFGLPGRVLSLGLSILVERWLRRREVQKLSNLSVIGANATWPFLTFADLTAQQSQPIGL